MSARNRPLSPHLQIYKMPTTAILSISHRLTGVVSCFGAVLLTYLLMAATYGESQFTTAQAILGSWFGRLVLLGVVFSLWYHFVNGIRHLIWDTGRGLELPQLRSSGVVAVIVSVLLTVATFLFAYAMGG